MARRAVTFALALIAASLATTHAHANGRFPASNAIAFDPSDPSRVVLRATFGLAVSSDGGHAWDWICERALGFSGPEDPTVGVFADGSMAVSLFEGLSVSRDKGCSYAFVPGPLEKKVFVDVATRGPAPETGVAISSGYANHSNDAGEPQFLSEIWITTDKAATWGKRGATLDQDLLLETVEWAASDPQRIYVSAARSSGKNQKGVLLRSDDAGATWKERPIDFQPGERSPYIAAVDPLDANVVYVRVLGAVDAGARLVVTRDGGLTWKTLLQTKGVMKGFALANDGKKLYAGGPKDGLLVATAPAFAFEKKSNVQIQCLATRKDELWACSNEASGFIAGVSKDDGANFEPRLHLRDLRGPLACSAGTRTAELCKADWPSLRATLGIESAQPSASASLDAGTAAPATSSKCGCNIVGTRDQSSNEAIVALIAIALTAARKKHTARRLS